MQAEFISAEDSASTCSPDIENLLKRAELENSEQLNLIETENQKLRELQKLLEERTRQTEELEKSRAQLNDQAKDLHKQFKQTQEINESLKINNTLLNEHEESLQRKYENVCSELHLLVIENTKVVDEYKEIWRKYSDYYENSANAVDLVQAKNKVLRDQSEVNDLEEQLKELEIRLKDANQRKGNTEDITREYKEGGGRPTVRAMVNLAELYRKTKCTIAQANEKSIELTLVENELQRVEQGVLEKKRTMEQEDQPLSAIHMQCEQDGSELTAIESRQLEVTSVNNLLNNKDGCDKSNNGVLHWNKPDSNDDIPMLSTGQCHANEDTASNKNSTTSFFTMPHSSDGNSQPSVMSSSSTFMSHSATTQPSHTLSDQQTMLQIPATASGIANHIPSLYTKTTPYNVATSQSNAAYQNGEVVSAVTTNTQALQPSRYSLGSQIPSFSKFGITLSSSKTPHTATPISESPHAFTVDAQHMMSKTPIPPTEIPKEIIVQAVRKDNMMSGVMSHGQHNIGQQVREEPDRIQLTQYVGLQENMMTNSEVARSTQSVTSSVQQSPAVTATVTTGSQHHFGRMEPTQENQAALTGMEFEQQDSDVVGQQGPNVAETEGRPKTPTNIDELLHLSDFETIRQLKKSPGEGFHYERRPMFEVNEEIQSQEGANTLSEQSSLLQSFLYGNNTGQQQQPQQPMSGGIASMFGMASPENIGTATSSGFFMAQSPSGGDEGQCTSASSSFSFFNDESSGSSKQQGNQPHSPGFSFNFGALSPGSEPLKGRLDGIRSFLSLNQRRASPEHGISR